MQFIFCFAYGSVFFLTTGGVIGELGGQVRMRRAVAGGSPADLGTAAEPRVWLRSCPEFLLLNFGGDQLKSRDDLSPLHRSVSRQKLQKGEDCSIFYPGVRGEAVLIRKNSGRRNATFRSQIPSLQTVRFS